MVRHSTKSLTSAKWLGTVTGIAAALLVENEKRCKPRLDDKEVEKIARNVSRYEPDEVTVTSGAQTVSAPAWPPPVAEEAFHGPAGDLVRAIEIVGHALEAACLGLVLDVRPAENPRYSWVGLA